ncbi:MAG: hypothetical protein HON47_01950 [Candidatus Diapherotrites archaeon]|jgi:hypothetical protein|uniref:Uncharacterized protein n=1 Tax=Candidatus Iainarchaeum sp. TaxID=3101447 RepID=A0A8T5GEC5_9ARCH|nr:hypothetical protein [Candidatus Diapherotrites archaeon]MBT7241106.1 hypothetical protein [Candidatus Diapherotrites archaeon]
MPKGLVGGCHLGGSSAHNRREQLKHAKKVAKLAAKHAAAEQRHEAHFMELQSWIKETRPFCLELIRDLRRKKGSVQSTIDALAISKWYEQKVAKTLKGCGKNKLSKNSHKVIGKRGNIVLMDILMRASKFRANKKLIEKEVTKAISKFNSEMSG